MILKAIVEPCVEPSFRAGQPRSGRPWLVRDERQSPRSNVKAMVSGAFRVSAAELTRDAAQWREPVAFVDLAGEENDVPRMGMPACPVIGIGPCGHPLAHRLDTGIESRFDGGAIGEAIARQPLAGGARSGGG